MKFYAAILIFFSAVISNLAVVRENNPEDELSRLFGRIASGIPDQQKILASDSIRLIIDSYVYSDSIFSHEFSNLKYLGQITSKDSRMKIITWNLPLKENPGRYYCYFINRRKEGNRILRLSANYNPDNIRTDTSYFQEDWYGALYYDMRPVRKGNEVFWMILGIDYGNPAITRKVIDVLSFDDADRPVFGKKWFDTGTEVKYREVLEYSFTAVISLRFMSDKMIVFDHLVPISPEYLNNREFYGPDYSYDAYRFDKGTWHLRLDVDARNKE
ncbi:MAG TPA: hypothetical protein PLS58_02165 [Bacteroidales bacterium]|jgi:hypothetical protein|nr:hypothetical protein [Bacteroidales bacterium]